MSRTIFHGPKDVRAIEVRLYLRRGTDPFSEGGNSVNITKTCLYNVDPLKSHFSILNLGFPGGYLIFLISVQKNIHCGYSLEPPRRAGSNEYPQSMF